MPHSSILIILIGLPFVAGIITPLLRQRRHVTMVMMLTTLIGLGLTFGLFAAIADGTVLRASWAWAPALGLDFTLRLDGLSWLFLTLIFGIGLLVAIYASYYMPREDSLSRLFAQLLWFMGAMLGIVLSGNVILLIFFWELTSLLSFLLIGYWHQGESARDAARTALVVTAAGGLCLFAGVLLLGHIAGSYDLDTLLAAREQIQASPLYRPALILIVIGALTKSAQFPFHFWLPQAMSAPTPVSAYLHSATMVKAGVFLLLRLWPILAGTPTWFWLVGGAGLLSLLIGAWAASFQRDLKAVLAYSTISHLGLITMLLGLGQALGAAAAIFHIINHATFKASLFMAAGAVDNETGTRDLDRLGGLRHVMPITTTLAVIAAAAMAGVPLLNGFLSKEMFFAVALNTQYSQWLDATTAFLAVVGAALSVTYSVRLVAQVFFGRLPDNLPRIPHEPPHRMRFPIGVLAVACLAVGILPALTVGAVLDAATAAISGLQVIDYNLAIWHGLNAPLLMSCIALIGGTALYVALRRRTDFHAPLLRHLSAKRVFELILVSLTTTLPTLLQRIFPARRLQTQLLVMVLVAVVLTGLVARPLLWPETGAGSAVDPIFVLLWVVGGLCAVNAAALVKFHRLAALALTGATGLVVCISFAWLSAPDLAITQLLVETVTTILILLGLRWLPRRIRGLASTTRRMRYRRRRDLLIAVGTGLGLAVLAYVGMLHPTPQALSRFFIEQAVPGAGGHNIVNVILVDFRALDTLGEISVLAIAALSVFALLRRFRPAIESMGMPRQQLHFLRQRKNRAARSNAVADSLAQPSLLMMLVTPLIVMIGLHLLLRGHDQPGGGFAAGIMLTTALIVLYMARGARWVESTLRIAPVRWIGTGLLLAWITGMAAMIANHAFLTSWHGHFDLPVLGRIAFNSALLFDLGVFTVVVGSSAMILVVLAHQALRRPLAHQSRTAEGGQASWN